MPANSNPDKAKDPGPQRPAANRKSTGSLPMLHVYSIAHAQCDIQ